MELGFTKFGPFCALWTKFKV